MSESLNLKKWFLDYFCACFGRNLVDHCVGFNSRASTTRIFASPLNTVILSPDGGIGQLVKQITFVLFVLLEKWQEQQLFVDRIALSMLKEVERWQRQVENVYDYLSLAIFLTAFFSFFPFKFKPEKHN